MKISFSPPDMSELEVQEVSDTIRSGWITTGPRTKEFEHLLAMCCGTDKVVWFEFCYSLYGVDITCIGNWSGR